MGGRDGGEGLGGGGRGRREGGGGRFEGVSLLDVTWRRPRSPILKPGGAANTSPGALGYLPPRTDWDSSERARQPEGPGGENTAPVSGEISGEQWRMVHCQLGQTVSHNKQTNKQQAPTYWRMRSRNRFGQRMDGHVTLP